MGNRKPKFDDQKKEQFIKALERGCSLTTAANYAGISYQTYRNHYREDSDLYDPDLHVDVDLALGERNQEVENALFDLAVNGGRGQVQAIKVFLSNMVSEEWADKHRHEISGPDGEPIKSEQEISFDEGQADKFIRAVQSKRARSGDSEEGAE